MAGAACCRPDGVGRCLRHAGRGPSRWRRGRCHFGRVTLFFFFFFSPVRGGANISSRFFPPKRSFCVFPFGFLQTQRAGASLTTSGPRHQDALREAAWLGAAAGAEICGPGCGALSSFFFGKVNQPKKGCRCFLGSQLLHHWFPCLFVCAIPLVFWGN